jgi:ABC-type molybdenum transport system ATPase subunit/photorepair protein PhrA
MLTGHSQIHMRLNFKSFSLVRSKSHNKKLFYIEDSSCIIVIMVSRPQKRRATLKPAKWGTSSGATSSDNVAIAVMGVTGAGKSTLIKTITQRQDIGIGSGLHSVLATSSSDRPMMASSSSSVISSDLAVIGRHRIGGADEVHIISPN